jgi:hypothetical protein
MSTRSLRARLERLQDQAGTRYVIGQDRHRDRKRRVELSHRRLNPGLTDAETAEMAELDGSLAQEDRDTRRRQELLFKPYFQGPLTEEERIEYARLKERYPPDPNDPLKEWRARTLAALEEAKNRNRS